MTDEALAKVIQAELERRVPWWVGETTQSQREVVCVPIARAVRAALEPEMACHRPRQSCDGPGCSDFKSVAKELADRDALIARLVEALGLLVSDCRFIQPDEPPEREIPTHHRVSDIRQSYDALAEARRGRG